MRCRRRYAGIGRLCIAPEKLLRAILLRAFYSVRSERELVERLKFDLPFRWFVGLEVEEPVWDHSTFSKNRDRLPGGAFAARYLSELLAQPKGKRLLFTEHFSVDGRLIHAWASMKSFKAVHGPDDPSPPTSGRNIDADFRGTTRSNATHVSTTDPEAKLYHKGPGVAKLAFFGHALVERRCGLIVGTGVTPANGHAERLAALATIETHAEGPVAVTLAADKGYDSADLVTELKRMKVRPYVAQYMTGRSAADSRRRPHAGYVAIQRVRKRIEQAFGWMENIGGIRKPMLRATDRDRVDLCLHRRRLQPRLLPRLLKDVG